MPAAMFDGSRTARGCTNRFVDSSSSLSAVAVVVVVVALCALHGADAAALVWPLAPGQQPGDYVIAGGVECLSSDDTLDIDSAFPSNTRLTVRGCTLKSVTLRGSVYLINSSIVFIGCTLRIAFEVTGDVNYLTLRDNATFDIHDSQLIGGATVLAGYLQSATARVRVTGCRGDAQENPLLTIHVFASASPESTRFESIVVDNNTFSSGGGVAQNVSTVVAVHVLPGSTDVARGARISISGNRLVLSGSTTPGDASRARVELIDVSLAGDHAVQQIVIAGNRIGGALTRMQKSLVVVWVTLGLARELQLSAGGIARVERLSVVNNTIAPLSGNPTVPADFSVTGVWVVVGAGSVVDALVLAGNAMNATRFVGTCGLYLKIGGVCNALDITGNSFAFVDAKTSYGVYLLLPSAALSSPSWPQGFVTITLRRNSATVTGSFSEKASLFDMHGDRPALHNISHVAIEENRAFLSTHGGSLAINVVSAFYQFRSMIVARNVIQFDSRGPNDNFTQAGGIVLRMQVDSGSREIIVAGNNISGKSSFAPYVTGLELALARATDAPGLVVRFVDNSIAVTKTDFILQESSVNPIIIGSDEGIKQVHTFEVSRNNISASAGMFGSSGCAAISFTLMGGNSTRVVNITVADNTIALRARVWSNVNGVAFFVFYRMSLAFDGSNLLDLKFYNTFFKQCICIHKIFYRLAAMYYSCMISASKMFANCF